MIRRLPLSLFASAALFALGALPVAALEPAEIAQRLDRFGITAYGKKPTADNLAEVTGISISSDRSKDLVDDDCAVFGSLPKLSSLHFYAARIGRVCAEAVAKSPSLTVVATYGGELEPGAFGAFASIRTLITLIATDMRGLSAAEVAPLARAPALRSLDLSAASLPPGRARWLDDTVLAEIGRIRTLQDLTLARPTVTATGMAALAALPDLRKLTITSSRLRDEALVPLVGAPKLAHLKLLSNGRLTGATIATLAKMPALGQIDLYGTPVGGALAPLAGLPALKSLTITTSGVTDDDLAALAAAPALTELHFGDNPEVGDRGVTALAGSKTLATLSMHRTLVTDTGLAAIAAMPTLVWLSVAENTVGDATAKALVGSRLKQLDMRATDLTDAGLAELARIPTLTSIGAVATRITDAGIAAYKQANPKGWVSK